MKNLLYSALIFISLVSCEKKEEKVTVQTSLWEGINETQYYNQEIFSDAYLDLYGLWSIKKIDGGFIGTGYEPNFDFLEIRKYGIYGFIRNDRLLEFGKIEILNQTHENLQIELQKDLNAVHFFNEQQLSVIFFTQDSLLLTSAYMDGYNYYFKKN